MRIESKDQFETLRAQAGESNASRTQQVLVCCGTGCLAWGSKKVAEAFAAEIAKRSVDATVDLFVKSTGCHGFCERGPLVALQPSGILYTKVKPNRVEEIVEKTLIGGEVIQNLLYKEPVSGERQREICTWLVGVGCRYAMVHGEMCQSWSDAIRQANLAAFDINTMTDGLTRVQEAESISAVERPVQMICIKVRLQKW